MRILREFRSSCRRTPPFWSLLRADVGVRLRVNGGLRRLVPAHGGSRPEPDVENVSSRVLISVVLGSTGRASPPSHNEHVLTCRAGWGATEAACSRCAFLVDDHHGSAGVLAFVL